MKLLATILDGLVIFAALWGGVTLFTMAPGIGSPEFLNMAAYVALWVSIPAIAAAAVQRIARRTNAE